MQEENEDFSRTSFEILFINMYCDKSHVRVSEDLFRSENTWMYYVSPSRMHLSRGHIWEATIFLGLTIFYSWLHVLIYPWRDRLSVRDVACKLRQSLIDRQGAA